MSRIDELREILQKLQVEKVRIVNTESGSTIAIYPAKTAGEVVAIVITKGSIINE